MLINVIAGATALATIAFTPPPSIAPNALPLTSVEYVGSINEVPQNYEVVAIVLGNGVELRQGAGFEWEEMAANNRDRVAFRFNQVSWNNQGVVMNDPSRNMNLWVSFKQRTVYWAQSGGNQWNVLSNITTVAGPDGEYYQ